MFYKICNNIHNMLCIRVVKEVISIDYKSDNFLRLSATKSLTTFTLPPEILSVLRKKRTYI